MGGWSLVLIAVALCVGVFIWRANRRRDRGEPPPALERRGVDPQALDIRNVGVGGVFSLRAFGDDMADLDVSVMARHLYDEDGYRWHELEGETGGRRVWLTVDEDDELVLTVTLSKFRLDEVGLDRRQIEAVDDDDDVTVELDGVRFYFDDRGEAVFYRHGDRTAGQDFTYWEFCDDNETRFLTVERWSDGSYEGHVSQVLREDQLTIYSLDDRG